MTRTIGRSLALATLATLLLAPEASAQRPIPVNIESVPAGATVYMDTETPNNRVGVTPLRNVRLPRGAHVLIFKLANHQDSRLEVNVSRRRETFRAELQSLATLTITPGNTAAQGAAVRIDGRPVGNVPYTTTLQPARVLVQVGREGYQTFSQWVDLSGGQAMTLPVLLEEEAPETGSLLVAGDTSGAAIYIDGTPRGSTPTVIEGLTAGPHEVEVRADDPNLERFTQTVQILAGERATLNPTLRPTAAPTGSLRVLVTPRGAIVSVDGEVVGEAPASSENLAPGDHIVEATAEGYERAEQTVTIESGRQRVISITLQQEAAAPGRVVVNANVDGATVLVDGEERGSPPVVIENADAGTHAIIVRAQGYQEYRETCRVGPGVNCEISADLQPIGTPVRVEANVTGAEFVVDGEVMGPVPWEGTVPVGSHLIEVRAAGHRSYTAQVALRPSNETRVFNVGLVGEDELTPEERREVLEARRERHQQAVARSGATLPNDLAVLDMSLGWPYLFEFRLGIGITDWIEAGIGLRSFGILTDFEGRVKVGYRPVRQVSVGAQLRLGGGIGPSRDATDAERMEAEMADEPVPTHPTNSFFMSLEALFSLHFLNAGNFTLWAALDYHSDRWDWLGTDRNCRYSSGCGMMDPMTDDDLIDGRQSLARFRLGGSLEFIVSETWNIWGSFEGILAGGDRRILGDVFGGGRDDIGLYARLGFTYKFGYTERDEDMRPPPREEPAAEPAPAPAE